MYNNQEGTSSIILSLQTIKGGIEPLYSSLIGTKYITPHAYINIQHTSNTSIIVHETWDIIYLNQYQSVSSCVLPPDLLRVIH